MRHLEERETLSLEWDKQDKVYCGEFPWLEGTPWFLKINKPISICGCSRFSLCLNCRLGPVGGFHLLIGSACLLSAPQPRERPRRLVVNMGLSARAESKVRKMEMIKHLGRGLTRSV